MVLLLDLPVPCLGLPVLTRTNQIPLSPQNPVGDVPEESRLLSLLAACLESMVEQTEHREHLRFKEVPGRPLHILKPHACRLPGRQHPDSVEGARYA